MNELAQKQLLIERIVPRLNGAPADVVQKLLRKSLGELEAILEDAIAKASEWQIKADAESQIQAMRSDSKLEAAWTHCLISAQLNGKRLCDTQANRSLLEDLIGHDEPTAAAYRTIVLQYPTRFSWHTPQPAKTEAEYRTEFDRFVRKNNLSGCDANFALFKRGAELENFARASQVEDATYAQEAALERQKFLIHSASAIQLKAEAAQQFATEHEKAVREDAERRHELVLSQQQHYPALPSNINGERVDAQFLRRISTTNYPLFKQLVRKYGTGNVTARLRGE